MPLPECLTTEIDISSKFLNSEPSKTKILIILKNYKKNNLIRKSVYNTIFRIWKKGEKGQEEQLCLLLIDNRHFFRFKKIFYS